VDVEEGGDHHAIALQELGLAGDAGPELVDQDPVAYDALPAETKTQLEIVDWPVPEGRLLLRDLIERATHDTKYRRELRRVTTLDIEESAPLASRP
jgi:hypothetical protein